MFLLLFLQKRSVVFFASLYQSALTSIHRPVPDIDWADACRVIDQPVPGVFASVTYLLLGDPDGRAKLVLPQMVPDIFYRRQFMAVCRQGQQRDVLWHKFLHGCNSSQRERAPGAATPRVAVCSMEKLGVWGLAVRNTLSRDAQLGAGAEPLAEEGAFCGEALLSAHPRLRPGQQPPDIRPVPPESDPRDHQRRHEPGPRQQKQRSRRRHGIGT